jgi:hypothetical protein
VVLACYPMPSSDCYVGGKPLGSCGDTNGAEERIDWCCKCWTRCLRKDMGNDLNSEADTAELEG